MKLIVNNKGEEIELDGVIRQIKNTFYVEIVVPDNIKLESIIYSIKGELSFKGKVTLLNNKKTFTRISESNPNESIYIYDAGYLISGYVEEEEILISFMSIYFKELDYFFVQDGYEMDLKKMKTELTITQKYNSEILLDDENVVIEYSKTAGINKDDAGHILFLTPATINIYFKNKIKIPQIFEEMNRIERVLGFVFNKKMNLIETKFSDSNGEIHDLIVQYQKDYNDVRVEESSIVDENSKQLLKDVLKKYYSDKHIAAAINMFYEYIFNDLNDIFEFTSLVNTLELILTDERYTEYIKQYALNTNEKLQENNKKMEEIMELLSKEQKSFINQFYRFENVELRDKIRYIFYKVFKLEKNSNSEKYISSIINTRNYFVHGGYRTNILKSVNMFLTKKLLKDILYILIIDVCTEESNSLIYTYKLSIPTIYNSIINDFN